MGLDRLIVIIVVAVIACGSRAVNVSFDKNYHVTWGNYHVKYVNQGTEIDVSMDKASGAGFESKVEYASGFFQIKMKLPQKDFSGVVVDFYLTSDIDNKGGNHDELDFEFLGSDGPPFTLQTNVFANDGGGREQRIHLWFDPTSGFHTYGILWNQHQIVFYVDDTPIRVFKNNTDIGVSYPSQQLVVQGSIWNGEAWASGGKKIDWSKAPFVASYQGFDVTACQFQGTANKNVCYISNSTQWWNGDKYLQLDPYQNQALQRTRTQYMYEDYCTSKTASMHKECSINNSTHGWVEEVGRRQMFL
ncbi:xyloglucan endotransglucosylase/hydrolase protein 2-like [Hibiscus syriacus]|uniref:xyloglucan endotransglucosylase/hydrolase protein 2-like n=1 Tax=Hibiscus syriacus TaxID=106335 RepID=UPI001921F5C4|nr:xyloglucan endotransglucosylase/hydrolase protein 2-like [Hibiscus syriacus]